MKLRWFDLHCDTLSACVHNKKLLFSNDLHIDLKRGADLADGVAGWTQVFACFIPDALPVQEAWELFLAQREVLINAASENSDVLSVFLGGSGFVPKLTAMAPCRAILAVEGGRLIGNSLGRLRELGSMGVKLFTLVWNGENEIASGANSANPHKGLTEFGREAIPVMEEYGITVDISHLSDRGVEDVFSLSKKPVVATHSNSRAICDTPRNLTDEQLLHLIKINGLCGFNFYPGFVRKGQGNPDGYTPEDARRQLDHILSLGGENVLALGSDFDGASMPSFIPDVTGLYRLYSYVVEWYGKGVADKIFYQNSERFFELV